jgi:hypothetical protein
MASTTATGKGSGAGAAATEPATIAIAAMRSVDGFILDLEMDDFSNCLSKRDFVYSLERCLAYSRLDLFSFFEFEQVGLKS